MKAYFLIRFWISSGARIKPMDNRPDLQKVDPKIHVRCSKHQVLCHTLALSDETVDQRAGDWSGILECSAVQDPL